MDFGNWIQQTATTAAGVRHLLHHKSAINQSLDDFLLTATVD
jgi:hypothetical protein